MAAACAAALLMLAPERAAAQSGATSLRVSFESAFERVAESTASTSIGASRLHADLTKQRSTRRSNVILWSGLTAEQSWLQTNAGSTAGVLSADGRVTLSRRNSITFSEQLSSAPTDVFAFLGSGASAVTSRAVLSGSELPDTRRTTSATSRAAFTRILDAQSQFSVSGMHSVAAMGPDRLTSAGVSGSLFRRLGAYAGWHVGYGLVQSTSRTAGVTRDDHRHDLDTGIDYARPLPFWRHTRLSVTTGSTVLSDTFGNHVRLNVTAELRHQLSAQWGVTTNYSRPISYVPGLPHPLISDAVRAAVVGTLPHRLSLVASGGAAWGTEESVAGARFASYTASVRVSRRLSAGWAVEGEYHDAWYRFDGDQPVAIPAAFARRGFRTGIVWVPAGRMRSSAESAK